MRDRWLGFIYQRGFQVSVKIQIVGGQKLFEYIVDDRCHTKLNKKLSSLSIQFLFNDT